MDWEKILKSQYQENNIDEIEDDELLDEAITSCERVFECMNKEELFKHSRTLAVSYLALKYEKAKKISNK